MFGTEPNVLYEACCTIGAQSDEVMMMMIFIKATIPGYCLSLNERERRKKNLFYKDIDKVLLIIKSASEDGNVIWIIGLFLEAMTLHFNLWPLPSMPSCTFALQEYSNLPYRLSSTGVGKTDFIEKN